MQDTHAHTYAMICVSNPHAAINVDREAIRTWQVGEIMFILNSYVSLNDICIMENPSYLLLIPGPDGIP